MRRPLSRPAPVAAPPAILAARGAEALRLGRFKDAVEAFKQLLRQDPQPQWRQALAQAYTGRARDFAGKGMFKEAVIVLDNTRTADGMVPALQLYLVCLIRQGQYPRAAEEARRYLDRTPALLASAGRLGELAAGLLLTVPARVAAPPAGDSWATLLQHGAEALRAWTESQPAAAVEQRLQALPLRSALRPLRLILKALITGRENAGKSAGLLDRIPADGVFGPFAAAAKMTLTADPEAMLADWSQSSAAQQSFIAEARGQPANSSALLNQILDAERRGPAALFALLIRQPAALPRADLRAACLDLLVQLPAQRPQFERVFGPLSEPETQRILALAAEAKQDWLSAEAHWRSLAESLAPQADHEARLAQGVIYRHLADPALPFPRVLAGDEDAQAYYLEQSLAADPGHLPTSLRLIGRYREAGRSKEWHRTVDRAVRAFPEDSSVLMQAVDAAVARKSYQKAAGYARTLLVLDPINRDVRRRMIELQVAQARKQMRAARPDLAWKALGAAAEWERADAPEASLRLGQGLVGLHLGQDAQAEAWLREGVHLAGGGGAGWFRAAVEATLMGVEAGAGELCGRECDRARQTPPDRDTILAIARVLGQSEIGDSKRALAPLLARAEGWLRAGARLDWPAAEFQEIADMLQRFGLFDTLRAYARQAGQRASQGQCASQEGVARFYAIVAETRGDGRRVSLDQDEDLHDLAEQAVARQDFHAVNRIQRFLDGPARASGPRRGGPEEMLDVEDLQQFFDMALEDLPAMLPDREIRGMLNDLGHAATVNAIAQVLRDSPLGMVLPAPQIRLLAEATVARVPARRVQPRR